MPTSTLTVLSFLASAAAAAERPASVNWRLEPGLVCPSRDQLQAAFRALDDHGQAFERMVAEVVLDRPARGILGVRVATLTEPAFDVRREIPVRQSSCQDLAQTVALLADAWLRGLPELAELAELAPRAVADETPPKLALQTPVPKTLAVAAVASVAQASSVPTRSAHGAPVVRVTLSGGALVGSATAPAATLGIDFRLSSQFGLSGAGTWIGDASMFDAPFGSISLQRQLFELEGTVRLLGLGGFLFEGLAGPVLWHGTVQSIGYPATRSADLLDPGFAAGARLEQHVVGALWLRIQVAGLILTQSYSLSIDRAEGSQATVGLLRNAALVASLGAAIDLF